jgi:hypothetical protein
VTSPAASTSTSPRPEPVLGAAGVAAALTSLSGLVLLILVLSHVLTPDGQAILGPALATSIPTVVGAITTLAAAWRARGKTLPLDDPRVAQAWQQILDAEQGVATAVSEVRRPPGPQTDGVADHAAPDPTAPVG